MDKIDRSGNRSSEYQYKLVEIACSPDQITEVSDTVGIGAQLNPFGYNEEFLELKEKLRLAFWRLVEDNLTERQRQVIQLYSQGNTQIEIAKFLGVNQSSITKSMNGNTDYKNGKKVYGGAKKKLIKIAQKDPEIKEIFARMAEIQSNNYF